MTANEAKTLLSHIINWNRIKSVLWLAGAQVIALIVDQLAMNLHLFNMQNWETVLLGLILGNISKGVHNYITRNETASSS